MSRPSLSAIPAALAASTINRNNAICLGPVLSPLLQNAPGGSEGGVSQPKGSGTALAGHRSDRLLLRRKPPRMVPTQGLADDGNLPDKLRTASIIYLPVTEIAWSHGTSTAVVEKGGLRDSGLTWLTAVITLARI